MILFFGGLGVDRRYFRHMKKPYWMFFEIEFTLTCIDNILDHYFHFSYEGTIHLVAFSIACPVVVSAIRRHETAYSNRYKLHLIDPPNPSPFGKEGVATGHPAFHPFKSHAPPRPHLLDMIYRVPPWLFALMTVPGIRHALVHLLNAVSKDKTPWHVDHALLRLGQKKLKHIIEHGLLSTSPFLKPPSSSQMVHVYTGQHSKYRHHVELLAETSPLYKLHVIPDANHHLLLERNLFVLEHHLSMA